MKRAPGTFGTIDKHARDAGLIASMTGNEAKVYMLMLLDAYDDVVRTPYRALASWMNKTAEPTEAQIRNVRKDVAGLVAIGAIRRIKRGIGRGNYSEYKIVTGLEMGSTSAPICEDKRGQKAPLYKGEKGSKRHPKRGQKTTYPTNNQTKDSKQGAANAAAAVVDSLRGAGVGEPARSELVRLLADLPDAVAARRIGALADRAREGGMSAGWTVERVRAEAAGWIAEHRAAEQRRREYAQVEAAFEALAPDQFAALRDELARVNPSSARRWASATREQCPDDLRSLALATLRARAAEVAA